MASIKSIKQGGKKLRVRKDAESTIAHISASGEPWARTSYHFTVNGEDRAYEVSMTPDEVRFFLEWPEFGGCNAPAVRKLLERVAGLNRDAGEIGAGMLAQLVDDARRILGK